MKMIWVFIVTYIAVKLPSGASQVAVNAAPVLQSGAIDYTIINRTLPAGSTMHNILVNDPEKGVLTYSIIGVKYFQNDTVEPVSVFDLSWALLQPPVLGSPSQCTIAESYPFPRNLFCIEANGISIKATSKYSGGNKADFSLFEVTVFVIDNGSPQRNLTTNVYFRVKDSCNEFFLPYTNLTLSCSDAREIIRRPSSFGEVDYLFTVPNNTKISRVFIEFSPLRPFKAITQQVDYRFSYMVARTLHTVVLKRRLLVNTTLDRQLAMFLWNPIDIIADTANVSLSLHISSSGSSLFGSENEIELFLLDRNRDYCANNACVQLYNIFTASTGVNSKPECARQDEFAVTTKYSSCTASQVAVNAAPVLQSGAIDYTIINRTLPAGSTMHNILVNDPEKGVLTYSIIGVKYFQNDTVEPVSVFDLSWALLQPPASGSPSQCTIAESYPFPRNLFCIEANGISIKATSKYSGGNKADFSLFEVTVLVTDNGSPQRNLTTNVYFRVKDSCSDVTQPYTNLMQSCSDAREIIRRPSSFGDVEYLFTVPNNTKISRVFIEFSPLRPFKAITQQVDYRFSYMVARTLHTVVLKRRLLVNTTLDRQLAMFLWNPIDIISDTANVSLSLHISSSGISLSGSENKVELFLLDRNRDYCANNACVELYNILAASMGVNAKPECARQDQFVVITKYSSCTAALENKSPVWIKKSIYASIPRNVAVGAAIFTIEASDDPSQKLLYSIIGVTYYANATSGPVKAYDEKWAVKSSNRSSADPLCKLDASLPSPRNLFCIEHLQKEIKSTQLLSLLSLSYDAMFVIDFIVVDDGKPQLNTTGQIVVHIQNDCPLESPDLQKVCLNGDLSYDWRSKANDSYDQSTAAFSSSADNIRVVKLVLYLSSFEGSVNEGVMRIKTTITAANRSEIFLQHFVRNQTAHINLNQGIVLNGLFIVKFEYSLGGPYQPLKMTTNFRGTPFRIHGFKNQDYCFDTICRDEYKSIRHALTQANQLQCLDYHTKYLMKNKYESCGIVFQSTPLRVLHGDDWKNGSIVGNVKAISNNAVIYSITSVKVWENDTHPATSASSASWVITSQSDALRACHLSESYPFPRNFFCVNATGYIFATSKVVGKFRSNIFFDIEVTAVEMVNKEKIGKYSQYIFATFGREACTAHSKEISDFIRACNSHSVTTIYSKGSSLNVFHFQAPAVKSLLGHLSLQFTIVQRSMSGNWLEFTIGRAGKEDRSFRRYIIVPADKNSAPLHNASLYDRPIELEARENFTVKITSDFPLVFIPQMPRSVAAYTVQSLDYCHGTCYDSYVNITRSLPDWYPAFPCQDTTDYNPAYSKYGYCLTNEPPTLTISDVELTVPPVVDAVIARAFGTDKEGTKLTYGIAWVHSKVLGRNVTQIKGFPGTTCADAGLNAPPLSYICIDHDTGEVKVISNLEVGELLTVNVVAVDSGSPKRHVSKTFRINIKDPCQSVKELYNSFSKSCMGISSRYISSIFSGRVINFMELIGNQAVRLHIDTNIVKFPTGVAYSMFTLRQVLSNAQYGKEASAVFNNTAFKLQGITDVQLELSLPFDNARSLELSAISYVDSSFLPPSTTIIPPVTNASMGTTSAPTTRAGGSTTAAPPVTNASMTTTPATTLPTFTTPATITFPVLTTEATLLPTKNGSRKRREVMSAATSLGGVAGNVLSIVNITLVGPGIRLYVNSWKESCGSTACVKEYQAWLRERAVTGLKSCQVDPLFTRQYYDICLKPPYFTTHPLNVSLKLNSEISISCEYQNYSSATFQWVKDGKVIIPGRASNVPEDVMSSAGRTKRTLSITAKSPEMQGYYSCMVTDALNHVVNSSAALVHFKDVSSSRMSLKINQPFEDSLLNEASTQYKQLAKDVTTALHAILDRNGMHKQRTIMIERFRRGSVIADAVVYYVNVSDANRKTICSQVKKLSTTDSSSPLQISSVETVSYDCCYEGTTGEVSIKGLITWSPAIAAEFDIQKCPYGFFAGTVFNNASRYCSPNFKDGAKWEAPDTSECAYKTLTTYKLENISRTAINAENAEDIASELNSITSTDKNITNRLDVKFTADTMENLVKSGQKLSEIAKDIVNTTSNMMDFDEQYVVESQIQYKSSSRVLLSLVALAADVQISSNTSVKTGSKNVALSIKPIQNVSKEILVKARRNIQSGHNEIDIIEAPSQQSQGSSTSAAEILLSSAMLQRAESLQPSEFNRVFSFVFETDRLFLSKDRIEKGLNQSKSIKSLYQINSRILSASIGKIKLRNLTNDEEMQGRFRQLNDSSRDFRCVFWDFEIEDGFGAWSSNGCEPIGLANSMQSCRCNHLTNFAILLDVTGKGTPKEAALALSIITYIGCGISLLCLLITFVTFVVFKNLREKRPPRILICLCFALIVTLIIFLAGIRAKDLKGCQTVAILIHYFVLASFLWMAVEGFNLYLSFVKVVDSGISRFMLKSNLFAWGLPIVIVAISAGVTKLEAYAKKNGDDEWLCMVTGTAFYVAYLTPILVVVTANLIVMVFVIRSLRRSTRVSKDRKMSGMTMARITAACSVLMGTTWIVGLFAIDALTLPMQILFCVFNSLQGCFIFIFYCVRNKDARKQWMKTFGIRTSDDSRTSSTGLSKERGKKGTPDSRKGLMISRNTYELDTCNRHSSTLTTSVRDSTIDDHQVSLRTFERIKSTKEEAYAVKPTVKREQEDFHGGFIAVIERSAEPVIHIQHGMNGEKSAFAANGTG